MRLDCYVSRNLCDDGDEFMAVESCRWLNMSLVELPMGDELMTMDRLPETEFCPCMNAARNISRRD